MSQKFIGVGLPLAFLILISIVIAVGYLGLSAMGSLRADARAVADTEWTDVRLANEAMSASNQNCRIDMQLIDVSKRPLVNLLLDRRAENRTWISTLLTLLQARTDSKKERELIDAVIAARNEYLESSRRGTALLLAQKNRKAAQKTLLQVTLPRFLKYHLTWGDFLRFQVGEMDEHLQQSAAHYAAARQRSIHLMALAVLLALAIAAFVVYKTRVETVRRRKAEADIRRMNEELEQKVLDRTVALERLNRDLSSEIAERKEVEQRLRSETAFFEALVNSTIDGILVVDAYNKKILQSRRFVDLFRLPQTTVDDTDDTATLRHVLDQVSEPECYLEKVKYLYDHRGEVSCDEIELKGGRFLERDSAPVTEKDGTYYGRIWLFRDITERKRMEVQLQHAQKMEAVGQLAAGIAHEINTPLQFIGDNTRFLLESWNSVEPLVSLVASRPASAPGDSALPDLAARLADFDAADLKYLQAEVPRAITESLDGIKRVTKIVQAMKAFSHPGTADKQATDLNKAIETTITVTRNEWKYVAELETEFADDLDLVPCHVGDVSQVILNLIVNSAHAIAQVVGDGSQGKGKIVIGTQQGEDWAEVSIRDTGAGIPVAIQPRIFEPFFTTKEVGKGTGQGLALAHAVVVKKHGGRLWFVSEEGKGTTFYIRLPLPPKSGEACPTTAALAAQPLS